MLLNEIFPKTLVYYREGTILNTSFPIVQKPPTTCLNSHICNISLPVSFHSFHHTKFKTIARILDFAKGKTLFDLF